MSTGVEILPLYLAFLAVSAGTKALISGVTGINNYVDNTCAEKEAKSRHYLFEAAENLSLQYASSSEQASHIAPEFDEETKVEELCGNFSATHMSMKLKTIMNDESILLEALGDYGFASEKKGAEILATGDSGRIRFQKDENGVYDGTFISSSRADIKKIYEGLSELYVKQVQDRVYENITTRAEENGLIFESEEVGEDNSIVLTFIVED